MNSSSVRYRRRQGRPSAQTSTLGGWTMVLGHRNTERHLVLIAVVLVGVMSAGCGTRVDEAAVSVPTAPVPVPAAQSSPSSQSHENAPIAPGIPQVFLDPRP